MNKINYKIKKFYKTLPTPEFHKRFYNWDIVQGYCKECSRYNSNYSCSPLDINVKDYILNFDYIDIIVTQLIFEKEDYSNEYSKEELNNLLNETFFKEKQKVVDKVIADESNYTKAQSLSGPCNYCAHNCKEIYDKCIHPEIRRYSLASLGIDSRKILKDLFDIELLLINGKLPKYLNNITSILYTK
ncbi:DUF2284 domain-containing protein [Methanosphaera sp. WGK6]|uniref:DUF2284 domain-containing protein n=1 Tax=Methanosphaera sp. WGK6 TaxID=1561964 RepID=UPI00084C94FF|nr:DUF2284 domain-containing protein [Methanosphaera sp. WGK6]OED30439.1 hypothetical protein NL43_02085 [Methanosphaera sp. WGK6]